MLDGFSMLLDYIKIIVFYVGLLIVCLMIGYYAGSNKKPIALNYSSTQIDTLISHVDILTKLNAEQLKNDVALTNIIAEQLKYEQSFSSNH